MWRRVALGLVGVLGMVAACADDAPKSGMAVAGAAGVAGGAAPAGNGGTRAVGGSRSNGGGMEAAPAAGAGGLNAVVGGAGGDAGAGGAGGDAGASGAGGVADAGGVAGAGDAVGGAGGNAGAAGQGPGVCEAGSPKLLPTCSPNVPDPDGGNECRVCLKAKCCDAWQACFGTQPRNACGYGAPVGDEIGEMDCVALCWYDQRDGIESDEEILEGCATACAACSSIYVADATNDLVGCAYEKCKNDCFPRP